VQGGPQPKVDDLADVTKAAAIELGLKAIDLAVKSGQLQRKAPATVHRELHDSTGGK